MIASLRALILRLHGIRSASKHEAAMQEELAHDLALMTEDGEQSGLSHAEARRQALLKLGGLEQTMQSLRDRRTLPFVEEMLQDLRFALRQLRQKPGFTLTAIITLALGFGASIAIFAFADAALLKPLPYPHPQRLAGVTETIEIMGPANLSWQDYQDWKERNKSFESLAVWAYGGYELRSGGDLLPVSGMAVSANFLTTLGVRPALGRDFNDNDSLPGGPKVVMMTHNLWQTRFGADPAVLEHPIEMNGDHYTVIGILPSGFQFAPRGPITLVTPIQPTGCNARRSCHSLNGVARLLPGVSFAQANDDVQRIANELQAQYPDSNRGQGGIAMPLAEQVVGKIRPVLYVLLSASLLLWAIACINVASLLLARSESRRREFALRSSLGASRLRLLRQFSVESASIVLLAAGFGLVLASFGMRFIMSLIPKQMRNNMPFLADVGLNRNTLLFVAAAAMVTFLLFSLVPALRHSARTLHSAMAEGAAGAGSLSWRRMGSLLVITEVAVAVVLLTGAGMLSHSLFNLLHTDLNFDPDHLVTAGIVYPGLRYASDEEKINIERRILEGVRQLPGVASAGFGDMLPVNINGNTAWIRFPDRAYDGKHIEVLERTASPQYFQTLRVPLRKGRYFTDDDTVGKPLVAIVNRKFAEKYFAGKDAVGQTFYDLTPGVKSTKTIVGVIDDLHEGALDDTVWPAYYTPPYQDNDTLMATVIRTAGSEHDLMKSLPGVLRGIDPDLAITQMLTMNEQIQSSQSSTLHRGAAWLAVTFAILALVLCAVGLYGVVSYSVSLRTREIGVRMALGAPRERIYRLVLLEAGQLSMAGIVAGITFSVLAASLLKAVLFGVSRWDPLTLSGACILLAAFSFVASAMPARRAAMANPMEAIRTE